MSMTSALRNSTVGMAVFAVVTAGLIAVTQVSTKDRISENQRAAKARALYEIVSPNGLDTPLLDAAFDFVAPSVTGHSKTVAGYRAIKGSKVESVILPVTAPDGYSGKIHLIVGIDRHAKVTGLRVLAHKETPGLGDKIDLNKSNWVLGFNGLGLESNNGAKWAVKKDGGQFDQFTGATITPRAIVNATARALMLFKRHRTVLLDANVSEVKEHGN